MEIKIYTSPTCPHCFQLKEFLKSNNIKYKEIDVSKNEKAAADILERSGKMGVPIIEISGEFIAGFNEEALKKKLYI